MNTNNTLLHDSRLDTPEKRAEVAARLPTPRDKEEARFVSFTRAQVLAGKAYVPTESEFTQIVEGAIREHFNR